MGFRDTGRELSDAEWSALVGREAAPGVYGVGHDGDRLPSGVPRADATAGECAVVWGRGGGAGGGVPAVFEVWSSGHRVR